MNFASFISTSGFLPWIELGPLKIPSYFFVISLVLCLCAVWIPKRAQKLHFDPQAALEIFIAGLLGGFLGSRLLHIFWEEPAYYAKSPVLVFDVMSGGFVWYGGAIGAVIAILAWLRFRRDRNLLAWLDFFAPVAALGYAGGRIACLLTGCCFGRTCHWHESIFRFPTQGFAVLWEIGAATLLLWLEKNLVGSSKRANRLANGGIFGLWIVLHGAGRLIMESFRADPRGPTIGTFTISTVLSAGLIAIGTGLLIVRARSTKI